MGVDSFTPEEKFFEALATTDAQQKVMAALQTNAEFMQIWQWFG